jgi:hypothetical protein
MFDLFCSLEYGGGDESLLYDLTSSLSGAIHFLSIVRYAILTLSMPLIHNIQV